MRDDKDERSELGGIAPKGADGTHECEEDLTRQVIDLPGALYAQVTGDRRREPAVQLLPRRTLAMLSAREEVGEYRVGRIELSCAAAHSSAIDIASQSLKEVGRD